MNHIIKVILAFGLLAGLSGLAACSDDDEPAGGAPAEPTDVVSAPSGELTGPPQVPFPANTLPEEAEATGARLTLTEVRIGRQPGYDRVVFEFGGTGQAGYRVGYVDNPTAAGSGAPVALRGESALRVVLIGIGLPADVGIDSPYDIRTRVPANETKNVVEVAPGAVFEGQQTAFVGLRDQPLPFRVFRLSDPPRVVVDIRDN